VGTGLIALIRRWFDIRPGEGRAVVYSFSFVALAVASFLLAKPIRNGLFLAAYGAHDLVYVFVGVPVALSLAMPLFARVGRKVGQRAVTTGSLVFFGLNVILFWWAFRHWPGTRWLAAAFYIWVNCYGIIAPVQAWTFANRAFDTRQAKRLFGLIGSGASIGSIVGGLLAQLLAKRIGAINLLLVLAALIFCQTALVNMAWSVRRKDIRDAAPSRAPYGFGDTARLIAQSPYLRLLAAVVFIVAVVTQWTQFQFSLAAEIRYADDPDRLTTFFGGFNFYMGLVALLVQLFVTGPMLGQFGVAVTILILPLALGFGSALIFVAPVLWTVLLTNGLDQGLRFSVDKATFELLYLPIPANQRTAVKGMIDLLVNRIADGAGGILLGVLTHGFSFMLFSLPGFNLGLRGVAAVNLVLIGVWIAVALGLRRGYVDTIKDSIHSYRLNIERETTRVLDRSTTQILAGALTGDDPEQILYALSMMQHEQRQVPHPAVRGLITHPSAAVRARALSILNRAGDRSIIPQVESMLHDRDLAVRTEALLYLAYQTRVDPLERIQALGDFSDFSIRASMVAFLSQPGRMQNLDAARVILDAMVHEGSEAAAGGERRDNGDEDGARTRAEAARLIAMLPPEEFVEELGTLVRDPDVEVARKALQTMGQIKPLALLRSAVERLQDPVLRPNAMEALVALCAGAVDPLTDLLEDDTIRPEIRREIPLVLAHIGSDRAREALTGRLLVHDVILRYRVIAALNKLHELHPELTMDRQAIETVLTAEVIGHYRSYQILGTLGDAFESSDPVAAALKESMEHEVERIFRLMGLRWPEFDMHSAYVGLQSPNAAVRANALEFLDNILKPQVRHLFVPLLDSQVTIRERVALANRLLGTTVDTREQAVAALIASDDPWLRSCGAYAIGMLHLTSLAHELDRLEETDDPLLRETVRTARMKLRPMAPAEPGLHETWQSQEESMGVG
jgi:AAA family ATP:ADP antiporter